MGRVQGKVAIITGGASGLGRASGVLLAQEGAVVVLTDIQADKGETAAAAIRDAGGEAEFLVHDVTDEAAWEQIIAATIARHGRLDIMVNAAGISGKGMLLTKTSLEDWRQLTAINLDGTFLGVKHGIQAMTETGGAIVNISSVLGLIGLPKSGAYAASKGGVRLLTKAAAVECKHLGIPVRVNSVHPGFIDTPMLQALLRSPDGAGLEKMIATIQGPLGEPNDIAEGVLYLASEASKFVTGTELIIDGGLTAQ